MTLDSATRAEHAQAAAIIDNSRERPAAVELLPARAIRAYVVRRARVECLDGEVWVTGPGIGDEVLLSGESLAISKPGKVVVQALMAARVQIRAAD